MEYARRTFQLDLPTEGGGTMRESLLQVGKSVENPVLPPGGAHLWEWFQELNGARTGNGFGPNPLPFTEISAWSALTGRSPRPWEVQAIRLLDAAYIAEIVSRKDS